MVIKFSRMWMRKETAVIKESVPLTAVHYHIFIYSCRCAIDCYAAYVRSQRYTTQLAYCQQFYILNFGESIEPRHFSSLVTSAPSPLYILAPFGNVN
jgi:hypothetical protein